MKIFGHVNLMASIFLLLIISPTFYNPGYSQQGYEFKFQVAGLQDTTIYLGYYFGESTYLSDTSRMNSNGEFVFSGKETLDHGIYFLVLDKTRLFDFAIGKDQKFSIHANTEDYYGSMKITGNDDGQLFLDNIRFNINKNKEAQPYTQILKDSTLSDAEKEPARKVFSKIDSEVLTFQNNLIKNHPSSIMAKILKTKREVEIPESPTLSDGSKDSKFAYKYFKAHYWDDTDLSDPTMLRLPSPLYKNKVEKYLERLVLQHPDSIIKEIDQLALVAKQNSDTYKYFIWSVTLMYQTPKIMGLDAVFVHIYDKYFASGEMDYWANENLVNNIKENANKLRKSLIGMRAPNLIMQDANLSRKSLHEIDNKYTVIYFYDPDCGFCKKETPKLREFYTNTKFDVEVFAVSADTSMTKMKEYIKEHNLKWVSVNGPRTYTENYQKLYDAFSTPTIYVIDERKKIIAKKLQADMLEGFLSNHEKQLHN